MTREEAEVYARGMTYRNAVDNALQGKGIPYRKATFIKLYELLDKVEPQESEDKCKNCEYYHNPDYTRCHKCKAESEE